MIQSAYSLPNRCTIAASELPWADRVDAHQLENVLRDAYHKARGCYETIRSKHNGKGVGSFHSALSRVWIQTLAIALHSHECEHSPHAFGQGGVRPATRQARLRSMASHGISRAVVPKLPVPSVSRSMDPVHPSSATERTEMSAGLPQRHVARGGNFLDGYPRITAPITRRRKGAERGRLHR